MGNLLMGVTPYFNPASSIPSFLFRKNQVRILGTPYLFQTIGAIWPDSFIFQETILQTVWD
jgi:hypothetical protein